jgi:hypothetical protein
VAERQEHTLHDVPDAGWVCEDVEDVLWWPSCFHTDMWPALNFGSCSAQARPRSAGLLVKEKTLSRLFPTGAGFTRRSWSHVTGSKQQRGQNSVSRIVSGS